MGGMSARIRFLAPQRVFFFCHVTPRLSPNSLSLSSTHTHVYMSEDCACVRVHEYKMAISLWKPFLLYVTFYDFNSERKCM